MANTTMQVYTRAAGRVQKRSVSYGSVEVPVSFTVGGNTFEQSFTIANATNTIIYNDDLSKFKYMYIAADYNTQLLLTDNASNQFYVNLLGSGVTDDAGVPLQFGSDRTVDANTRINTIQAFNTSGNTVQLICFAVN